MWGRDRKHGFSHFPVIPSMRGESMLWVRRADPRPQAWSILYVTSERDSVAGLGGLVIGVSLSIHGLTHTDSMAHISHQHVWIEASCLSTPMLNKIPLSQFGSKLHAYP